MNSAQDALLHSLKREFAGCHALNFSSVFLLYCSSHPVVPNTDSNYQHMESIKASRKRRGGAYHKGDRSGARV